MTNALIAIEEVVSRFMLKYEQSTDRAIPYTEHACDCVQHFELFDSNTPVTTKVDVETLGYIEMPDDMVGFNDLLILQSNGLFWSCTEKTDIITTTTFTGLVEGVDDTIGEGADIDLPKSDTYGGVGGVNDYNYTLDWTGRRIYVRGITDETVALQYTGTGIEATGTTYVPALIIPMIDAYLLWKKAVMDGDVRIEEMRTKAYEKEEYKVRNFINSMSYSQWHDVLLGLTTQAQQR